jgi:hypothetical protein
MKYMMKKIKENGEYKMKKKKRMKYKMDKKK